MNPYSAWYNSLSKIAVNHYATCSRYELAQAAFKAGYEAGRKAEAQDTKEMPRGKE